MLKTSFSIIKTHESLSKMQTLIQTLIKPNFNSKIIIKQPKILFPTTKPIPKHVDLSLNNIYNITQHKNLQATKLQTFDHHYSFPTKTLNNFLLPFLSRLHTNITRSTHSEVLSTRFNKLYGQKLIFNHSNIILATNSSKV